MMRAPAGGVAESRGAQRKSFEAGPRRVGGRAIDARSAAAAHVGASVAVDVAELNRRSVHIGAPNLRVCKLLAPAPIRRKTVHSGDRTINAVILAHARVGASVGVQIAEAESTRIPARQTFGISELSRDAVIVGKLGLPAPFQALGARANI